MKKVLAIFAHNTDILFGPSASLIKYAQDRADVRLVIAANQQSETQEREHGNFDNWTIKETELIAKHLGLKKLYLLNQTAETLSQQSITIIKQELKTIISRFKPDILVTFDPAGLSRHIDHILLSVAVSELFTELKTVTGKSVISLPKKLYHFVIPESIQQKCNLEIESFPDEHITTMVDTSKFQPILIAALKSHKYPGRYMRTLMRIYSATDRHFEFFHLADTTLPRPATKETDLFERCD